MPDGNRSKTARVQIPLEYLLAPSVSKVAYILFAIAVDTPGHVQCIVRTGRVQASDGLPIFQHVSNAKVTDAQYPTDFVFPCSVVNQVWYARVR